jgi:hypothetical protein
VLYVGFDRYVWFIVYTPITTNNTVVLVYVFCMLLAVHYST